MANEQNSKADNQMIKDIIAKEMQRLLKSKVFKSVVTKTAQSLNASKLDATAAEEIYIRYTDLAELLEIILPELISDKIASAQAKTTKRIQQNAHICEENNKQYDAKFHEMCTRLNLLHENLFKVDKLLKSFIKFGIRYEILNILDDFGISTDSIHQTLNEIREEARKYKREQEQQASEPKYTGLFTVSDLEPKRASTNLSTLLRLESIQNLAASKQTQKCNAGDADDDKAKNIRK